MRNYFRVTIYYKYHVVWIMKWAARALRREGPEGVLRHPYDHVVDNVFDMEKYNKPNLI